MSIARKTLSIFTRKHTRQADSWVKQKEWDSAKKSYQSALKIDPNNWGIMMQYAHSTKELGSILEASRIYLKITKKNTTNADVYLQYGHIARLQGRHALAWRYYIQCLNYKGKDLENTIFLHAEAEKEIQFLNKNHIKSKTDPYLFFRNGKYNIERIKSILENSCIDIDFIQNFDPVFYASISGIHPKMKEYTYEDILENFCQSGIHKCLPFRAMAQFEPIFYNKAYISFNMEPSDSYRHYINYGIREKFAPNEKVWLKDTVGLNTNEFVDSILLSFIKKSPSRLDIPKYTLIEHIVHGGIYEILEDLSYNEEEKECLYGIYKKVEISAPELDSFIIISKLHEKYKEDSHIKSSFAKELFNKNMLFDASVLYVDLIKSGYNSVEHYLYLIECYEKAGSLEEAIAIIDEARNIHPDKRLFDKRRFYLLDQLFHKRTVLYKKMASSGNIPGGQEIINDYCTIAKEKSIFLSPKTRIKRVALFALLDLPQCKFYRIDQKITHLKNSGYIVELFNQSKDTNIFLSSLHRFDSVIFYRVSMLPNIVNAIRATNTAGIPSFYEIDDLLFLNEEYPGPFEGYNGQIDRETYNMLAMGVPLFKQAISMCKYGIGSTPALTQELAKLVQSGQAFTHRNGMGTEHENYISNQMKAPRGPGHKVSIFYGSGTKAHKKDFTDLLEPALLKISEKYGDTIKIILMGWFTLSKSWETLASQPLIIEPDFEIKNFWNILKEMDINCAVLSPSLNVDCKSEIKWMEAGMLSVPSIVSNTKTYSEIISHGHNGLISSNADEWFVNLERLIQDKDLRALIGANAYKDIIEKYSVKNLSNNIDKILSSIHDKSKNKIKVLIVNVYYAPQIYGGATRVVYDNINYISKKYGDNIDIEVFCTIDSDDEDYIVSSWSYEGVRITGVTRSAEGENPKYTFDEKMGNIFNDFLVHSNPDIIHFHCMQRLSSSLLNEAIKHDIPYIVTAHDAWWISDYQFFTDDKGISHKYNFSQPNEILEKYGFNSFNRMQNLKHPLFSAKAILGVSEKFSEIYRNAGVPNVKTISNGVSELSVENKKISFNGKTRVAHIGGMVTHKGYHLLEHLIINKEYKNIQFIIIDHSKPSGYKNNEVWGDNDVTIFGEFKQSDIAKLYSEIDVLVAPSVWSESFGLVSREAHISGCWVVASDRGAIGSDITEDVDGHIIDVSTVNSLDDTLNSINMNHKKYSTSPKIKNIRKSREQAEDLYQLYISIVSDNKDRLENLKNR